MFQIPWHFQVFQTSGHPANSPQVAYEPQRTHRLEWHGVSKRKRRLWGRECCPQSLSRPHCVFPSLPLGPGQSASSPYSHDLCSPTSLPPPAAGRLGENYETKKNNNNDESKNNRASLVKVGKLKLSIFFTVIIYTMSRKIIFHKVV